jgi:hypothetical protein
MARSPAFRLFDTLLAAASVVAPRPAAAIAGSLPARAAPAPRRLHDGKTRPLHQVARGLHDVGHKPLHEGKRHLFAPGPDPKGRDDRPEVHPTHPGASGPSDAVKTSGARPTPAPSRVQGEGELRHAAAGEPRRENEKISG